jgi:hypothetical protein
VSGRNLLDDEIERRDFDIVLWNIKVTNKHPTAGTFGEDCSARLYWDFVRCEGNLFWKTPMDEPLKTSININPDMVIETPVPHRENRYWAVLGDRYSALLQERGVLKSMIPKGMSEELYFLMMIRNDPVAYPIMNFNLSDYKPVMPYQQALNRPLILRIYLDY